MRKTFILCLTVLLSVNGWAQYVNKEQAMKIASDFIQEKSGLRAAGGLELVYECEDPSGLRAGGSSLYYIFNQTGKKGFVIVSGDERRGDILAYSFKNNFSMQIPSNVQYILDLYRNQIVAIRNNPALAAAFEEDDDNSNLDVAPEVEPLITTQWGQEEPYNMLTPIAEDLFGDMTNVPTGCTATAIAQVMNYHQWPEKGTGIVTNESEILEEPIELDLSTVTFDWANMIDAYTQDEETDEVNYTAEQAEAVAELMNAVGMAIETEYDPEGSGAGPVEATMAMIKNLGYNENLQLLRRSYMDDDSWNLIMKLQLTQKLPIVFMGMAKDAEGDIDGHTFVCDGYDDRANFYHINWGWDGFMDGYYDIDELNPEEQGTGGTDGGNGYTHEQFIIVDLCKPDVEVEKTYVLAMDRDVTEEDDDFPSFGEQGAFFTDEEVVDITETFEIKHLLFNAGINDFVGNLQLALSSEELDVEEELEEETIELSAREDMGDSYYSWTVDLSSLKDELQEGEYRFEVAYQIDDDGDAYAELPTPKGSNNYLPFTYKNGKLYFGASTANEAVQTNATSIVLANETLVVKGEQIQQVIVFNVAGQVVHSAKYANEAEVAISMNGYANSTYIVVAVTANGNQIKKVLKN